MARQKSYSREGQDLWVLETLNSKKNGYFVDIGAHNGVHASNSYLLEQDLHWSGLCVEPHPESFKELTAARSCICENCCIYDRTESVQFVARGKNRQGSGIYDVECSRRLRDLVEQKMHRLISVPALSLMELLAKRQAPAVIDYLSLDTEGSEYQILRAVDFAKYTFMTITVEHNFFAGTQFDTKCQYNKERIGELLLSNGYKLAKSIAADDWFIHISVC